MKTISLIREIIYKKGETTKYWRDVECKPQTVELKEWGNNDPLFYLKGTIINSHDIKEIGKEITISIQSYYSWINQSNNYIITI